MGDMADSISSESLRSASSSVIPYEVEKAVAWAHSQASGYEPTSPQSEEAGEQVGDKLGADVVDDVLDDVVDALVPVGEQDRLGCDVLSG